MAVHTRTSGTCEAVLLRTSERWAATEGLWAVADGLGTAVASVVSAVDWGAGVEGGGDAGVGCCYVLGGGDGREGGGEDGRELHFDRRLIFEWF